MTSESFLVNHNRDNSSLGKMRLGFFIFLCVLVCYSTSPSVFKNKEWNIPLTQKFYSPAFKKLFMFTVLKNKER